MGQCGQKVATLDCIPLLDTLRFLGYVTNLENVRNYMTQVSFDRSEKLELPQFLRLMRMIREEELTNAHSCFKKLAVTEGERKLLDLQDLNQVLKKLGYSVGDDNIKKIIDDAVSR